MAAYAYFGPPTAGLGVGISTCPAALSVVVTALVGAAVVPAHGVRPLIRESLALRASVAVKVRVRIRVALWVDGIHSYKGSGRTRLDLTHMTQLLQGSGRTRLDLTHMTQLNT